MAGRASKNKGAHGERIVKRTLERDGWIIPSKQTTGLAGDDLFARDPEGTWWSIEVKHTRTLEYKYLAQARQQAKDRARRIKNAPANHVSRLLNISFSPARWMLVWVPSAWGIGKDALVFQGGGGNTVSMMFLKDRVNKAPSVYDPQDWEGENDEAEDE